MWREIGRIAMYDNNFHDHKIRQKVNVDGNVLVLLDIEPNQVFNENIFLLDSSGNILWQVEKIHHPYHNSPYDGVEIENGEILAFNYDSHTYIIEKNTGKIKGRRFTK